MKVHRLAANNKTE